MHSHVSKKSFTKLLTLITSGFGVKTHWHFFGILHYNIFIPSRNLLRRGYSISAMRVRMYVCRFSDFKQNLKKTI